MARTAIAVYPMYRGLASLLGFEVIGPPPDLDEQLDPVEFGEHVRKTQDSLRVLVEEKAGDKALGFEYLKADAPVRPRDPEDTEEGDGPDGEPLRYGKRAFLNRGFVATGGWEAVPIGSFLEPFSGGGEVPEGV